MSMSLSRLTEEAPEIHGRTWERAVRHFGTVWWYGAPVEPWHH